MKIPCNKTEALLIRGELYKNVKIVINVKVIGQVNFLKYLGCSVSTYEMNMGLFENIQKHNELLEDTERYETRIQLRMCIVLSTPALMFGR
jgi:hypothetical protein